MTSSSHDPLPQFFNRKPGILGRDQLSIFSRLIYHFSFYFCRFWDSYTGAEVRKIKDFRLCEDLPSQLLCCQISKDGQKIAVTTADGAVYLASVNAVYGLENQDVCSILAALRLE